MEAILGQPAREGVLWTTWKPLQIDIDLMESEKAECSKWPSVYEFQVDPHSTVFGYAYVASAAPLRRLPPQANAGHLGSTRGAISRNTRL